MKERSESSLEMGRIILKSLQMSVLGGSAVLSTGCISFEDDDSWAGRRAEHYEKRGVSSAEARHAAEWDSRMRQSGFPFK